MDATLALAPGLPVEDVASLAAAAAPGLTDRSPAVQKRAYKLLATVCAGRPDFLAEDGEAKGLGGVLATLLAAGPRALPAAKRHRLAVVREAVLALRARAGPGAAAGQVEGDASASSSAAATLIAEAVLATKEANHKTRTAAYTLLVDLGSPASDPPGSPPGTGLRELFAVVLGGLAGGSPHMVSASTMAAARLVHAFVPGPLGPDAGRLLPAILPLLRTPAREVIKSVLGFIKVCVGRLPAPDLEAATPDLLDGLLRWSDDPKNKFRLKVRVIVERLARRIGFEAVAASMPASDAKLLTHIRKQGARKARKKAAGAEEDKENAAPPPPGEANGTGVFLPPV
jgi:ribosomal RNA-processing protein 12